jgi:predicted metal-dependent enzyme (double-stranded beta helix superfamily)
MIANCMRVDARESLCARLDAAIRAGTDANAITASVKSELQAALRDGPLALDQRFLEARGDTYARRLFHRDPEGRYTVVVMTWGPGQGTALHDHAGIWCVECVVDGRMEVAQFDLVSHTGDAYRFAERNRVTAGVGSAGCLIPPFEYHTLANARPDGSSITLHVYGGEMDHCHVFEPAGDGTFARRRRDLRYHD